jgi:hypothetical protein
MSDKGSMSSTKINRVKMLKKILILLIIILNSCTNIGVDGPDVIKKADAYKRFNKILLMKLLMETKDTMYLFPPHRDSFISGCMRDIYYFSESVDYCEKVLLTMGGSEADILSQYIINLKFICDLKPVDFNNMKKTGQGEIRLCAYTGQKEEN